MKITSFHRTITILVVLAIVFAIAFGCSAWLRNRLAPTSTKTANSVAQPAVIGVSIRQTSAVTTSTNASRPVSATFRQPTLAGDSLVAFVATANTTVIPSGWTLRDPNVAVLTAVVGASGVPAGTTYAFGSDSAVTQLVEVAGAADSGWLFSSDDVAWASQLSRSLRVPSAGGLMLVAWAGLSQRLTGIAQTLPGRQTAAKLGHAFNSRASGNGERGHLALEVSAVTSEPFAAPQPFTASAAFTYSGSPELVGDLVWIPPAVAVSPSPTPIATGPTSSPTPTTSSSPTGSPPPSASPTVKPSPTPPTATPRPPPTPTPISGGKTFWAQIPAQSSFATYANWLGCSVPMAEVYNDNSSSWETNFDISAAMAKVDAHVPVMLSLAVYPNSDATGDDGMRDILSGRGDNAMRTAAAQILAQDPPAPDGNIYIRIFWETPDVTGTWGNSTARDQATGKRLWNLAYAHVADIFHAASPRFKMVWDIAPWASRSAAQSESYYPGDPFVDVIGQDTYFGTASGEGSVSSAWSYALNENGNGLTWLASFAAQHGKPTSVDEWGIDSDDAGPIVTNLAKWAKASNTAFMAYFDADWQYADFLESNRYQTASSVYKANACAR